MASAAANGDHILIVDDNPHIASLLRHALLDEGYHITVAHDGLEALAQVAACRPDLILLDLNLPRKDGREVLAEIKADEQLRMIPVVVLTTSAAPDDVTRAYGSHANCYITKPVDLDQFLKVAQSIENFWLSLVRLPS